MMICWISRSSLAGLGVMVTLLGLLTLNLVQMVRGCDQLRPIGRGRMAPPFTLKTAAGEPTSLLGLRGKVVLLSFWASWCGPCVTKMPFLVALQKELGPRGLDVLSINIEGSTEIVRNFVARTNHILTMLVDEGNVAARYGVQQLPHLVLVGRGGVVRYVTAGGGNETAIRQAALLALAAKENR